MPEDNSDWKIIIADSFEIEMTGNLDSSLQRQKLSDVAHQEVMEKRENSITVSWDNKCWYNDNISKMEVSPGVVVTVQVD